MESKFIGVVDLVSMTLLLWDPTFSRDGSEYLTVPLKCHQEGSGESLKSSFMKDNSDTKLNKECLSDIFDYRSDLIDEVHNTVNTESFYGPKFLGRKTFCKYFCEFFLKFSQNKINFYELIFFCLLSKFTE